MLGVPSATFYSLQVGPQAAELREVAGVSDLGPELTDWARTAAAVKVLDQVQNVSWAVQQATQRGALRRLAVGAEETDQGCQDAAGF